MLILTIGHNGDAQAQPTLTSSIRTSVTTGGRCYDHIFLQFLTIFREKFGVFLKNQCHDQNFANFSFVLSQKRHFFAEFFGENIF
jgi:hypothetical protein